MRKKGRPSIAQGVQNELWARAAGRCEFRGCNELLYVDDLTKQRSNLATIAHIVAYSPEGPRGDPVRSEELQVDVRNLMLTCRVHGKVIDDRDEEAAYPESLLLEFKQEHESRICMLTGITEDAQTHVLLVQAPTNPWHQREEGVSGHSPEVSGRGTPGADRSVRNRTPGHEVRVLVLSGGRQCDLPDAHAY